MFVFIDINFKSKYASTHDSKTLLLKDPFLKIRIFNTIMFSISIQLNNKSPFPPPPPLIGALGVLFSTKVTKFHDTTLKMFNNRRGIFY